jgi:quercetin dioxygenase-like cupin family protein
VRAFAVTKVILSGPVGAAQLRVRKTRAACRKGNATMSSPILRSTLLAVCLVGFGAPAVDAAGTPTLRQADALVWTPAEGLPPGADVAVLYGDPSKDGPFTLRFKFPDGYEVATHSHPTAEFVTILSGKGRMAFGETADAASAQPLAPGGFMVLPAGAWHHLWIDADMIIELHSTGPFGVELAGH